jgi:hypothetical protein
MARQVSDLESLDITMISLDLPKVNDRLPFKPVNSGQFKKGQTGNPLGRPRSSREALGTRFIEALSEVFQKKGKAAINKLADTDPATFVRVCASLMPKELLISQGPLADLSSQEIAALAYAARKAVALADAAQEGEGTGKLIQEQASQEQASTE